jgi:D-alanine--poly(phosphoribitol) ligase subunit 2
MKSTEEIAKSIIENVCDSDEMFDDYDMDLFEEGFMDSFGVLSIILEIEKEIGIVLQPTDVQKTNIQTVNNFIEFLDEKRK